MSALRYPHKALAFGETPRCVAPGVHWLRMPLPMDLDHINLYLLEDGDRFWIVDTGLDTEETREHWLNLFEQAPWDLQLAGVICTHMHTDHTGLAGWLCRKFTVALYMTRSEYLSARVFSGAQHHGSSDELRHIEEFYGRTGVEVPSFKLPTDPAPEPTDPVSEEGDRSETSARDRNKVALPRQFHRLRDGSSLRIGGRAWHVVVGCGHSPEHACLHCPELGVMISGDQILPRITPNVSVLPTEPNSDPLREWFESLERLRLLPAETFVLPAHNLPFYGLHQRIDYLRRHHIQQLRLLYRAAHREHSVAKLMRKQFGNRPQGFAIYLAVGECLAHLHFLCSEGRLRRRVNAEGQHFFEPLRPIGADSRLV